VTPVANGTVLKTTDPVWEEVLGRFPVSDVYFERGYCEACAIADSAQAYLFVYTQGDAQVIYPFLSRPVTPGAALSDIWSPYGYSGPLATTADPRVLRASADAFDSFCRETGAVTSFTRFHPLLGTEACWAPRLGPRFVRHTCYIDLRSPEVIDGNMRAECRNMVRKGARAGLAFEVRTWDGAGPLFLELYEATMRKLSASDWYSFPISYYETLVSRAMEKPWISVVTADGRPCAVALILTHKPFAHYHLSAWDPEFKRLAPNNYLLYSTALLAWSLGYTHFHLGGGVQGDDALFLFKASFNRCGELDFKVGEWVHLADEYGRLCVEMGRPGETQDYFPPYRARESDRCCSTLQWGR